MEGVPVKALTIRQPWASLIALGVKTIVDRDKPTRYRGPIAIHAGKALPRATRMATYADPIGRALNDAGVYLGGDCAALPLGAVVATALLTDCVPMVDLPPYVYPYLENTPEADALYGTLPATYVAVGTESLWLVDNGGRYVNQQPAPLNKERPFGDFAPGRWAWLLDDVKPTTDRCPGCWGEGGDWEPSGDPGWSEEMGWPCDLCHDERACDPVPAKGRQGLWEWTP